MKKIALYFLLLLTACNGESQFKITALPYLTDTLITGQTDGRAVIARADYFLIEGKNTEKQKAVIEKYIKDSLGSRIKKYFSYEIYFYKKSKNINKESLQNSAKGSRWKMMLEEDPAFSYKWMNGKLY